MSGTDNVGFIIRLADKYLHQSPRKIGRQHWDEPFIINEQEKSAIRKIIWLTVFWAALIGAIAVLALYLPQYEFPHFFGKHIAIFGFNFEYVSFIYGITLIWPEIWLLNYINIKAVKKLIETCTHAKFLENPNTEQMVSLRNAGLEISTKELEKYKIDPYLGMNKIYFWGIFLINRFKATLSNIFIKIVVKRILGRYALRQFMDLISIPVFSFWNAWASYIALQEAKIRIMAPSAIDFCFKRWNNFIESMETLHPHLYSIIHYAVILKRKYNYSQYLLVNKMENDFPSNQKYNENFHNELNKLSELERKVASEILLFALIIDGKLSATEKNAIKKLQINNQWFVFNTAQSLLISSNYANGKGLTFE